MRSSTHSHPFLSRPHDRAAWVSAELLAIFLLVLGLNLWTALDGEQSSGLVFLTFLAMLAMAGSLALSVFAIVRHGERSLVVYLSLITGILIVVFFAIEIIFGHD